MHLFDSKDPRKTQSSFYITIVLVSVVTYSLSGFAAWWIGESTLRQKLKDYWDPKQAERVSENGKPKGSNISENTKTRRSWRGLRHRWRKQGEDEEVRYPPEN